MPSSDEAPRGLALEQAIIWIMAGDELPDPDEVVLLYLPDYQYPRPHLARLIKGDPEAEGEHYRLDWWQLTTWAITSQPVRDDHQWARVPAPEGVTWRNVPASLAEPEPEPAPEPAPPAESAQLTLFGDPA